jgi:hypothetical protein
LNPQNLRIDLAATLEQAAPSGWEVQTSIRPTFTGPCIQVGHCSVIRQQSYRFWECSLTVTLWVNEGDSDESIVEFYALLAEPTGIRALLAADPRVARADVLDCGPRDWAAPTWLAGDIELTIQIKEPS